MAHPDDVASILSSSEKGLRGYERVSSFLGVRGLLTRPSADEAYCIQRRKIQRAFSPHYLKDMSRCLAHHAAKLRDRWLEQASGCAVTTVIYYDVSEALIKALCEIAGFRVPSAPSLRDVASAFRRVATTEPACRVLPFGKRFMSLFSHVVGHTGPSPQSITDAKSVIHSFAEKVVRDSPLFNGNETATTLWERIQEGAKLSECSRDTTATICILQEQVKTFLFAGFETTMNSLLWGILLLAENPAFQSTLADEIIALFPPLTDKPQSRGVFGSDDVEELRKLPMLRAFVKETLRLFPPAPIIYRTTHDTNDVFLQHSNVYVPPKTLVAVNLFAMQRSPNAFTEPLIFNPRRWVPSDKDDGDAHLSSDERSLQVMERHMAPFSAGSRSCVGRDLASAELLLFFATLLQSIIFEPVSETQGLSAEAMKGFHVTLTPEDNGRPFRLKIRPREHILPS